MPTRANARAGPGREHLLLYARLKNLGGRALRRAVDDALRSVNLLSVGDDLVGGYRCEGMAAHGRGSSAVAAAGDTGGCGCGAAGGRRRRLAGRPALRRARRPAAAALPAALRHRPSAVHAPRCRSGGMKRRLSVAISLVGDPAVVYLDEPSTGARPHAPRSYCSDGRRSGACSCSSCCALHGAAAGTAQGPPGRDAPCSPEPSLPPPPGLDPASRQLLWNVIREARRDRAVVLTTHSMEEAEALCDRCARGVRGVVSMPAHASDASAQQGLQ